MGSKNSKDTQNDDLNKELMLDMKQNTHFKSKEIQEWYDKFKKDFPSGFISRSEFRQMYLELTDKVC